jgi:integration host factor subunit beta
MTKADLVERLAQEKKMARQHAELLVDTVLACIEQSLCRGERIEIRGFGTFQVRSYKGQVGRNPKTGKTIQVAPKRLPFFQPSRTSSFKARFQPRVVNSRGSTTNSAYCPPAHRSGRRSRSVF